MVKIFIFMVTLLSSFIVYGEELSATSKIKTLYMGPSLVHKVLIQLEERPEGDRPSECGANGNFDFAIDLRSDYGKEYYSAALAAYASQKTVRLISYDSCDIHSSVPDLKSIWLK